MKLYIDTENIIHALEDDGSQDFLIQPNWKDASESEADLIRCPTPTLENKKIDQLAALAADFAIASKANVTDDNAISWNGGISSALSIYGAVQLAAAGGVTLIDLFDSDNLPHSMTIKQGISVAEAINMKYQSVFAKYQKLKVAIQNSKSADEVKEITWQSS